MYRVFETKEYITWFTKQTKKDQGQIQARIAKIRINGYFGIAKKLTQSRTEVEKWAKNLFHPNQRP